MNYFPFHLGDYAAHTGHLEPMEDLAYRRLLDLYYLREGPLPADIQATAKLVRMRSMAGDVEAVLGEFFVLTDEGWTHTRCDEEIEKMQDKQAKARKSAQASVNARRANVERSLQEQSTGVERSLDKSVTDVELPTPTPTPVLKNTPLPPNGGDVLFAKFWSAYPRKVGKDVARKAFDKRKPSTELVDLMVQAVNRQKMTPQWAKDGGQFIPHPSTWINEGRWMDGEQPGQPDSTWFREAGFDFDWVANNAGCYPSNFKKFANGKRLEAA